MSALRVTGVGVEEVITMESTGIPRTPTGPADAVESEPAGTDAPCQTGPRGYTRGVPKRLGRYLLRETALLYPLGVAAFCLLLSIDLLSVLASFLIEQEAGMATVVLLLIYRVPFFLHLSLPITVVFAVLLATGRLARDSELKAAYGLGVRPSSLTTPFLVFGVAVAGLTLLNNGVVEPRAERAYTELIESFVFARPPTATQNRAAFRTDDGVYYAGSIRARSDDSDRADLRGVVVLDPDGTITSAPQGVWDSEARTWSLADAVRADDDGAPVDVGEVRVPFALQATATQTLTRSEFLTLGELGALIDAQRATGAAARELRFRFHRRIADAMAAVVFAVATAALGLTLRSRAAGFGWTIVLLVAFWALWVLSESLFERSVLGPAVAAWFTWALVAVGAGGVFAWSRAR